MPIKLFKINDKLKVKNATKIVQLALSHVMECYFAIRTSPLTSARIDVIKQKLNNMYIHFIALFQLNLRFCEDERICLPESRKIHAIMCTMPPFLESMGCIDVADTASWESVHRVMTVSLWERTSKRFCSMNAEMSISAMLLNYRSTTDFIDAIAYNNVDSFLKKVGPYIGPDNVVINPILNKRHYDLQGNSINQFESVDRSITLDQLLLGSYLTASSFTKGVTAYFEEESYEKFFSNNNPDSIQLLTGISIEGNVESKLGKVYLYATNMFRGNKCRYDFVMVNISDGVQPAQLLAFFLITGSEKTTKYYAIIRYLQPVNQSKQPDASYNCPFSIYEWEYSTSKRTPILSVIEVETIAGPAYITPVFRTDERIPICKSPSRVDNIWFIDRTFFDRAGWDDIHTINIETNINLHDYEIVLPTDDTYGNIALDDVDDSGSSDGDHYNAGSEDSNGSDSD